MPEAVIISAVRAPSEKRPYYGLATLCVGVGQGEATIMEWRLSAETQVRVKSFIVRSAP